MTKPRTAHSGFTLIELLVVIGIGIILATILLVGEPSSLNSARRAKASAMTAQIQTAVLNYYTEYSVYPVSNGTGKVDIYVPPTAQAWVPMTIALCGSRDPLHPDKEIDPAKLTIPNARRIEYLVPKLSDLDATTGALKTPYKDRNNNPTFFFMAIDSNYDGTLGDKDEPAGKLPDFAQGKLGGAVIKQGVAVWSNCDQDPQNVEKLNFWVHTY